MDKKLLVDSDKAFKGHLGEFSKNLKTQFPSHQKCSYGKHPLHIQEI